MSRHSRPRAAKRGPNQRGNNQRRAATAAPRAGDAHLLYGFHAVAAALANPNRKIRSLWGSKAALERLQDRLGRDLTDARLLSAQEIDAAAPEGAVHQGLLLDCAPLPAAALEDVLAESKRIAGTDETAAPLLILDQVSDPHNVGAILRSAAAFGAAGLIMHDRHAPPETAVLAKAASGALETAPIARVGNLARALDRIKEAGYWIVGLDGAAERRMGETDIAFPAALVLGAEGAGLRRLTAERCDALLSIPMARGLAGSGLDSVNVSNAAAIALYEIARSRRAAAGQA
ncbi:MAG: 23S rRNA (guanosine(2251)-2'-O)-methyltransferase RlmB [Alphaproteobacteria bacterium]|nr:23S rRNA (guanosine(2251)-2'-O)-methyltransferase RlmB [Alphaproteobacteria bacterium]